MDALSPWAVPEDFLSVCGADRNEICSGSGIIVILNADSFSFGEKCFCPNRTYAEGFIRGIVAMMFTIAGAVIVYGVSAGVV